MSIDPWIAGLFVTQHLLCFLAFNRRTAVIFSLISIFLYSYIYLVKNDTYDLERYIDSFSWNNKRFELGYKWLANTIHSYVGIPRYSLGIIQVILTLFYFSLIPRLKKFSLQNSFLIPLILLVSSVAFILSVNNAIRQGFATVILIHGLISLSRKEYLYFFFSLYAASLFHRSSFAFALYSAVIVTFIQKYYLRHPSNRDLKISFPLLCLIFVALATAGYFLMIFLIKGGYIYESYLGRNYLINRSEPLIKLVGVSLIYAISEWLFSFSTKVSSELNVFRLLRLAFLILLAVMTFDPRITELFARIFFFYLAIELIVVLTGYQERKNFGTLAILIGYCLALNAINVLAR